jgi:hypothetical protein
VQAELHRLDGGNRRPPGNTQQRVALKAVILSQIDAYHRVTKDALFMLKTRAGMLHSIASAARQLWGGDARARFSEIGPIVATLSDKATQKANYIEKLHAFYEGEGRGVFMGEDLLNFLKSPPHAAGGVLANLQRGCRMERIGDRKGDAASSVRHEICARETSESREVGQSCALNSKLP